MLNRKCYNIQSISYRIFGEGNIDPVIEMRLGAVAGEWWHIAKYFSDGQANPRKDMYMMTGCALTLTDDEFKSFLSEINEALFISPIVNMEKLITDMMMWSNVTESDLQSKKEIPTKFGETLSWDYLCYVREYPIEWRIPTCILYGEKDNLTSGETISEFSNRINATLTVMDDGEHWFHTDEQMKFLDDWIINSIR